MKKNYKFYWCKKFNIHGYSKIIKITVLALLLFSHAAAQNQFKYSPNFNFRQESDIQQKSSAGSHAKYVLMSLILPGAGEWFMGHKGTAKFFFTTEAVIWSAFFGSRAYVNILENDFQAFAARHAGINSDIGDDQYWIDIGSAENIYEFNEKSRADFDLPATYPENGKFDWQWDSKENRTRYNNLRVKQHDWERRATFVVSGLILNRIISAVDVVRLIRKDKNKNQSRLSRLYFDYQNNYINGEIVRLNLSMSW